MRRSELKEKLEQITEESRRFYRQYPDLHLYLLIWEDYERLVELHKKAGIHPPKDRAREKILDSWGISKNTFYVIMHLLENLCEDMPKRSKKIRGAKCVSDR